MTIKQILEKAIKLLKENNIDQPIFHAKILLSNVLQKPKEYLIIHENELISTELEKQYEKDIIEFAKGKPMQYITNYREFMKLDFYVDENVLIPRADTEILVEEVLKICEKIKKEKINILDLCTGSGIIAISLAKYIPNSAIIAVDISKKALDVAKKNAKQNKVNIEWIESDLFENVKDKFDLIVSNPPYIKTKVIKNLSINVQKEPTIALDGGEDGLKFYNRIIKQANKYLKKEGYLCLEIGYDQKESVTEILEKTQQYKDIYSRKDLNRK